MSNDKPKYDFQKELRLGPDDRLEGYMLWHEGDWYDLHAVEKAFEMADEKGYVKGALLAYPDGTLVVIVGRNTTVRHEEEGAAHYPVTIQQFDDFLDCGLESSLTLVQCPVEVLAKCFMPPGSETSSQSISGQLTAIEVDERRGATVVIGQQRYLLRDLLQFGLA